MIISTKGRYALCIMVAMAQKDGSFVALKDLAEQEELSKKYLEAIAKVLVEAGYLIGQRGKSGGYKLSKHPSEYTVGNILKLTEGSLAPVSCLAENGCSKQEKCVTCSLWKELDSLIEDFLNGITLEELARRARED